MGIIIEKQGTIDSIVGDELLVRFDSSGDRLNDALNAIDTAVSIFEYLDNYNDDATELIKVRIGIHSDTFILANFGSKKHRLSYSMIGDGINVAKALQRSAGANGCLLSQATYTMIEDSLGELPSFDVKVKNGSHHVRAYQL